MTFPAEKIAFPQAAVNESAYDTDGDGIADYFLYADEAGRVTRIGYVTDPKNNLAGQSIVDLDAIRIEACRHLIIILDGFGYDVVRDFYYNGRLRLFHPPAKVIATYPTVTDVCLEDSLGHLPCRGIEASYFDRLANRKTGGAWDYLAGKNELYNKLMDYRAHLSWDAIGYFASRKVFNKELNELKRRVDDADRKEFIAYFVSSAGVSTVSGRAGQQRCLEKVEQLVNQLVHETHGLVKVTLLSDHGHTYKPGKLIDLEGCLKAKGWRLTSSLKDPRDVVHIRFGLLTYASLCTLRPAELAEDLTGCTGVQLASYADGDTVVVLAEAGQRAAISQRHGRYSYRPINGDPLGLQGILDTLQPDAGGYYDAEELLRATADHEYPAPLQRLWRAHLALVENPPDVIISLKNDYMSGSDSFAGMVPIMSTHGGLNQTNSATFIMSTVGAIQEPLRSTDIPSVMSELLGRPWPGKKPAN